MDRVKYGEIKGVTDKDYYTNSNHIPVSFPIPMIRKMNIEGKYHKLTNGGFISYIELDTYTTPEFVEKTLTTTFNNTEVAYVGLNFHIRYCMECGHYLHDEETCICGSRKIQGVSRITGYLALDERFGVGKDAERHDRLSHESFNPHNYNM